MLMKMMMMMMMMGVAMLLVSAHCLVPPSVEELSQVSQQGEKYLDQQIQNAVSGVKEMKSLMEKSGEDHKTFLSSLERTNQQKEDALRAAQEMERKLDEQQQVCNETMQALWDECKPCLKNTCVKFYSRTCSSGAGLVGRQLEEVLNRTSPFSLWVNGQNVEVLQREDRRQNQELQSLEERFSQATHDVDSLFQDSMRAFDHMDPFGFGLDPFRMPGLWGGAARRPGRGGQGGAGAGWGGWGGQGEVRVARSPLQHHQEEFQGFQSIFTPMMDMARNFLGSMGPPVDPESRLDTVPSGDGGVNEDAVVTRPFGDGQMTCREIRRNSAGCISLREECDKCKEIRSVDCSGQKPLEGPLKAKLEQALALAESFTREYNALLRSFEEQMLNTSSVLDLLNQQFGWVSALANLTRNKDGNFRIQAVVSSDSAGPEDRPGDTSVSVQLFDAPPMTFSVPSDLSWDDPKFSEVVAQEALDRYKQTTELDRYKTTVVAK